MKGKSGKSSPLVTKAAASGKPLKVGLAKHDGKKQAAGMKSGKK
jgi:hypothetical protein